MTSHNIKLGQFGEGVAARTYERLGYEILDRNWRVGEGELDMVAVQRSAGSITVCFVEVKTRTSSIYGTGAEAVDWKKQKKIRSLAALWLDEAESFYDELRFDVAEVSASGEIEIYEGCF